MLGILAKLIYRSGFKFLRGNCGKTRLKSHPNTILQKNRQWIWWYDKFRIKGKYQ